ncbi:Sensor histidine kinase, LytS/YehU family [Dyadobacter sp. SG02]|uniref:sensor histidine kinase n=1 Tax=Dyadobacter sp. SG02 TaxID=1855291 RepID=UPI0008B7483B|nr:histidine kinase [Dyadobacter sp. SG02]SEJ81782.1 Sensor histidine kinase, LytS/YehU family [Dyadobacter sp. SG02]
MLRYQVFWLLCFLWPLASRAQFIFQNLKEEDGLSSKDVRCLYRDTDGFLWMGATNGLNRYDGELVKHYEDLKSIKNMEINDIYPIDGSKNLLIATSVGLKLFNKSSGSYQNDSRFDILAGKTVISIRADAYRRLWIACASAIYIYDNQKLSPLADALPWTKPLLNHDFSFAPRSAFVWDEQRMGFWIGGRKSYFVDCKNHVVYDSTFNPRRFPLLKTKLITAIAIDRRHNIWYATEEDLSLHYWDAKTGADSTYRDLDGRVPTDRISYLFVDAQDRLWISTWMFAAYVKESRKAIRKIPYSQDTPYSIAYGYIQHAIQDVENDIWFATNNGLSKLISNNPFQYIYKVPSYKYFLETGFSPIGSLSKSGDTIFAAKEDGLVEFHISTGKFIRHVAAADNISRNKFYGSVKIGNTWWFAGSEGLYYLKIGEKSIHRFTGLQSKGPSARCNLLIKDRSENLWFQINKDALYRLDTKTYKLDRFDGTSAKYGIFQYRECQSSCLLDNGDLLFAMNGQGLLRFSEKTQHFDSLPVRESNNFYVTQLIEDPAGDIWAAIFKRGLYKMNWQGAFTDSLYLKNSLMTNYIATLAVDRRGVIWAGGPGGLIFFPPDSKKVTRVQIDLGKTLQDWWNYILVAPDNIYAAMLDHIVVIDPMKFNRIAVRNPPHITSVRVFEKEISDSPPLSLVMGPDEDFITFQFASLKHRDIPSLQYSYQLEGIDENWVNAGRAMSVSYNSLAAGDYVFKVRSTDQNDLWMNEITKLKIRITPYWWQTWWFFILVCCVSGAFLYLTFNGYLNRKHKRELAKTIEYFLNSVYGENSVSEICWDIVRSCTAQLHFEDCTVFLWDEGKQKLIQKAVYGSKDLIENEITDPLELELGEGIVGVAARIKKTLIIPDTSLDSRYIRQDANKFSEIAVPILHEGKLIGVLDSEHTKKNFFTEEQAHTLLTIASINANKIAEAQAEEEAAKKEIMLLEINRMLAESQLMALRAQMNPHFVFNCLNSIQECIVTQKYTEASKYLNKFSKLFRMVLNNSDRNLVTIEEEKNVLELYLELEKMRFEQSFVYCIDIDEELEADDILLPSMLLQPYVENAIWHGLMHKEGYRELKISFDRVDEEIFKCTIDDNGIGRKKSFEIRERNTTTRRHKSKGLQIAKDRLTLIDRQGKHASVEIVDKYDPNDVATGTMIVIELSTSLDDI